MVDYFLRGLALGIEFPLRSGQLYGKFRIGLSKNRLPLVMRSHLSFEKRFSAHKTRPNPNGLVQTFYHDFNTLIQHPRIRGFFPFNQPATVVSLVWHLGNLCQRC